MSFLRRLCGKRVKVAGRPEPPRNQSMSSAQTVGQDTTPKGWQSLSLCYAVSFPCRYGFVEHEDHLRHVSH